MCTHAQWKPWWAEVKEFREDWSNVLSVEEDATRVAKMNNFLREFIVYCHYFWEVEEKRNAKVVKIPFARDKKDWMQL